MAEKEDSLCRVDWKLGQALMPDHFLKQEESLRLEWEVRFRHQPLPMWGVAELAWDEGHLRNKGHLLLTSLQLVFETGVLVDVPGNAHPPLLELPKAASGPVDIYVHLDSGPEVVKGGWSDNEGSFVELRLQKLILATELKKTAQPGFHLLRLAPLEVEAEGRAKQAPVGWRVDLSFVPAMVTTAAIPAFAEARFLALNAAIERWKDHLRKQSVEHCLAVHKRVEAVLYLRQARALGWELSQIARVSRAAQSTQAGSHRPRAPSIQAHPFELYRQLVSLYMDVFAFQSASLETFAGSEPLPCMYRHEELAEMFAEVEAAIEEQLERPAAGSPEWEFKPDSARSELRVCTLPKSLPVDAELYFLIHFTGTPPGTRSSPEEGPEPRLRGLKLASLPRLEALHARALPGISLERVHLVPFPHNFDSATVQFWRVRGGPEWSTAHAEGAVAYDATGRAAHRSFLYSPNVRS